MSIAMVPHVNRQEVYTGEMKGSVFEDSKLTEQAQQSVSPVNFFIPDRKKYPHFKNVKVQFVHVNQGDCLFVPAFYFYHIQGFSALKFRHQPLESVLWPREFDSKNETTLLQASAEEYTDSLATGVSLVFQSNSQLLSAFYEAIELKIIK